MHTHDGTAEQLLHQIPSESLQQLLRLVRSHKKTVLTRIAGIDSYLKASPGRNDCSGDVFQIHGPPGSGKTHLLYFFLATCTMPRSFGGWNKAAFVYDLDGHFSISRFRDIVMHRLQESDSLLGSTIVSHIEHCLKSLHVFRPASSDQLAVSLAHLPSYHSKHFPDFELGLIAIHSLDAFYWIDRFKAEQIHAQPSLGNILFPPKLALILDKVQRLYGVVVLLTFWGLPQHSRLTPPFNDQHRENTNNSSSLEGGYNWHQISLTHSSRRGQSDCSVQTLGRGKASRFEFEITTCGVHFKSQ